MKTNSMESFWNPPQHLRRTKDSHGPLIGIAIDKKNADRRGKPNIPSFFKDTQPVQTPICEKTKMYRRRFPYHGFVLECGMQTTGTISAWQ